MFHVIGLMLMVYWVVTTLPFAHHQPGGEWRRLFARMFYIIFSITTLAVGMGLFLLGSIPPPNLPAKPRTLPAVMVVAKVSLDMETSDRLHLVNDILYHLPDGRLNQRHQMVQLYGPDGLDNSRLGQTDWFDMDSICFKVVHVDSSYHLAMYSDSTGYLRHYRAEYPVKLVRKFN